MTAQADNGRQRPRYGNEKAGRGQGGESHQVAGDGRQRLTTQQGVVVADDQNTLRVGERGPGPARGLPLPREDLPLRPRADPRAGRPRARLRRARLFRELRAAHRHHARRPLQRGRPAHAGVRPLLHRRRKQGLRRPRPRRARVRGQVLHPGGQLGPRRQQHPGVLHPGRDQVPRPDPCRQAGAGPRLPAGADRARQLLGLRVADARGHPHADVGHVRPGDPALVPVHGGVRRPHLPPGQRARPVDLRQVPLEAEAGPAVGRLERGRQDQRRRPRLPPPRPVGRDHAGRLSPNGSWGSSCSTRRSPTASSSTCSTRPSSSPRRSCRSGGSAGSCSTGWSTTSSPRPSRSRSARRTSSRASTSPTIRCCRAATSPTSTPRSSGSAARTSRTSRQRAEVPVRELPAGRPHGDRQPDHAAPTTSPTRGSAPTAARARTRRAASPASRRRRQGPSGGCARRASPTTTARPGSSTSARPTSSAPHRGGVHLRAQQVRAAGYPERMVAGLRNVDDELADDRRREPRPARLPGPLTRPRSREGPAASPALSILANPPGSFAGRKLGILVTDGADARSCRAARGRGGRAGQRRADRARRSAASTPSDGSAARGEAARRRPVGALRRRRGPRVGEGARRAGRAARRRRTSSPTRSPTASSSATPAARGAARGGRPAGRHPRPTVDSSASTTTSPPISSPDAVSCGSGTACVPPPADARPRMPPFPGTSQRRLASPPRPAPPRRPRHHDGQGQIPPAR